MVIIIHALSQNTHTFFMNTSIRHHFKTRSIGSIASELIDRDQEAYVIGTTSKGIYIKISPKWLIFLSFESFRGPLTITIANDHPILQQISLGDRVCIASKSISFPKTDIMLSCEDSEIWQSPISSSSNTHDPARNSRLREVAREVMVQKSDLGCNHLISHILGLTVTQFKPIQKLFLNQAYIRQLRTYIQQQDTTPLAGKLSQYLGYGQGLTPAADDFILGLLLSLNRLKNLYWTAEQLNILNQKVVEAAYEKTTTLSANLIECASLGQADERLINTLDWIVLGEAREPDFVSHLIHWGSSSGVYAFIGIAVMLTTY